MVRHSPGKADQKWYPGSIPGPGVISFSDLQRIKNTAFLNRIND